MKAITEHFQEVRLVKARVLAFLLTTSQLNQTYKSGEGNDYQKNNALMCKQILPTGSIRKIWRRVRRIRMSILGLIVLIITITKFSDLIGYQQPRFELEKDSLRVMP